MAKHKSITHAHQPIPVAPPPAPRLAASLFTSFGELLAVAVFVVGVVFVGGALLEAHDEHLRAAWRRQQPSIAHRETEPVWRWRCGFDPRFGERTCRWEQAPVWREPVGTGGARRYYAREGV